MKTCVRALDGTPQVNAVDYGSDRICERRLHNVDTNDLVIRVLKRANQRLAEMTAATLTRTFYIRPTCLLVP